MKQSNDSENQQSRYYGLSPKQNTMLRQIARSAWTAETAQHKLQGTLGSLYKRKLVAVVEDRNDIYVSITVKGTEALRLQSHSDTERSAKQSNAPFASIIRELANFNPAEEPARHKKVVPMRRHRAA